MQNSIHARSTAANLACEIDEKKKRKEENITMNEIDYGLVDGQSFDKDMGEISQAVRLEYIQEEGDDQFKLLQTKTEPEM